jgi:CRISPR-associated exonuclease Cas4
VIAMPYLESDLLALSGLQHLAFCERQWGLIHVEQAWSENVLTAEGRVLHERSHEGESELRGGILTARGVRLRSLRLGLAGVADVIEFHRVEKAEDHTEGDASPARPLSVSLSGRRGLWRPFPVEFKHGRPKAGRCDEVQLCAQALCLEEMLDVEIPAGALFYGQTKRRMDVELDASLRSVTERLAVRMHALFDSGTTPPAAYDSKKCKSCSLLDLCRPEALAPLRSSAASGFLAHELEDLAREMERDTP